MGLKEDLRRNREVYRMLTAQPQRELADSAYGISEERRPSKWNDAYDDSGGLNDADFAAKVAELQSHPAYRRPEQNPSAMEPYSRQSNLIYGLDGSKPVYGREAETLQKADGLEYDTRPLSKWQPEDYAPQPAQAFPLEQREDLLDTLLTRLETNARRYPQDLTDKE